MKRTEHRRLRWAEMSLRKGPKKVVKNADVDIIYSYIYSNYWADVHETIS
jgi:hypothetical protein